MKRENARGLASNAEVQSTGPTNHNQWLRKMWDPTRLRLYCAVCCMIKSLLSPKSQKHLKVFLHWIAKFVVFHEDKRIKIWPHDLPSFSCFFPGRSTASNRSVSCTHTRVHYYFIVYYFPIEKER